MQYITIVRGRLKDSDQSAAMSAHNAIVDRLRPRGEPLGSVGHQAYVDTQDPGGFVAVDRWSNIEGLHFVGAFAAASFGPVMRFVSGTPFTGRALAAHIANGRSPTLLRTRPASAAA